METVADVPQDQFAVHDDLSSAALSVGLADPVDAVFRAAFDAHPDCAILIERDRTVSFVSRNGRCPRTLEPFEILAGTDWVGLYPDRHALRLSEAFDDALAGHDAELVLSIRSRSSKLRQWQFRLTPILSEDGACVDRVLCLSRPTSDAVIDAEARIGQADHRIKNSLASIASLLRMQARTAEEVSLRDALHAAGERIMGIGRIHAHLQPGEGGNRCIPSRAYLGALGRDIVETLGGGRVTLLHEIEDIPLLPSQAKAFGVVATEAIINALRHGFGDEGGLIHLVFGFDDDDTHLLRVSDSGRGLPEGFDPGEAGGKGWRITSLYAQSISGTVTLDPAPMGGTRLAMRAPA
ncbi:MAG: histidine kinase dimerization/phosphoacceptor domain -containing protein [Pseudomonadota bacterium]